MRTYWDLAPQARAQLTEEQVEAYVDVELMRLGVPKLAQPPPETETPGPPKSVFYRLEVGDTFNRSNIAFRDLDAAELLRSSGAAWIIEHDYNTDLHVARRVLPTATIVTIEACSETDHAKQRARLTGLRSAKEAREKATRDWRSNQEAQRGALAKMWTDWEQVRGQDRELRAVVDRFDEYTLIASRGDDAPGDVKHRHTALIFLAKVHAAGEICSAFEWCGRTLTSAEEIIVAEARPGATAQPRVTSDEVEF